MFVVHRPGPQRLTVMREESELLARVAAEFREMPGMVLTLAQASRLFNLELIRCERVLRLLVHHDILATDGRAFARAGTGRLHT